MYCLDGLFLVSAVIYLVNKFDFKVMFSHGFCHAYVNDLICIPFNVPWGRAYSSGRARGTT